MEKLQHFSVQQPLPAEGALPGAAMLV